MNRGSYHCIGGSNQNYPKEKEMQERKVVVLEGFKNSWVLGSFNGLEPGSPELMIRKWKREKERERERHGDPRSDGAKVF